MSQGVNTWRTTAIHLLLIALAVLAVFGQVHRFPFVDFDDPMYTFDDPLVKAGLTFEGAWQALVTFKFANWHPLTWWSLMLDSTLFGLNPRAFHLVNLALHLANAMLLYAWLRQAFGYPGRCLLVALLFAIHPQHVEAVAWISCRKDLLCTFWMTVSLLCYTRYARDRNGWLYAGALAACALGLMGKSMIVTLPAILLLLDVWPLCRWPAAALARPEGRPVCPPATLRQLVLEKIPFAVLCVTAAFLTFLAQKSWDAISTTDAYPSLVRLQNAALSFAMYVLKTVLPLNLSVYYQFDVAALTRQAVLLSLALVAGVTVIAARHWRTRPALALGWAWFVVMLLPVIGILQLGAQARADRYTYIPLTGLFIAVAWGVVPVCAESLRGVRIRRALAATAVVMLAGLAFLQTSCWQSSVILFEHAARVSPRSSLVQNNLASAYMVLGQIDDAQRHAQEAVNLAPGHCSGLLTIAECHVRRGEYADAYQLYVDAVPRLDPFDRPAKLARSYSLLAMTAGKLKKWDEAERAVRMSLQRLPDRPETYRLWAGLAQDRGDYARSLEKLERALALAPKSVITRSMLVDLLATCPDVSIRDPQRALVLAREADQLSSGRDPWAHDALAAAFGATEDFESARRHVELAAQLAASSIDSDLKSQIADHTVRIQRRRWDAPETQN